MPSIGERERSPSCAIGATDLGFYLIGQLANANKEATALESGANFMLSVVKGIKLCN
jgi:hypothetical protein